MTQRTRTLVFGAFNLGIGIATGLTLFGAPDLLGILATSAFIAVGVFYLVWGNVSDAT